MAESETESNSQPATAKISLMQILTIVGLVVVAQSGVTFTMDRLMRPADVVASGNELGLGEGGPAIQAEDLAPANYLPLDPALVVNLSGADNNRRFLQATVQLMTRDQQVYEAAKTHSPAIRSALIMLFGTVDPETVNSREGKLALQNQARSVADEVLLDLAGTSGVDAVYLTSFVLQ